MNTLLRAFLLALVSSCLLPLANADAATRGGNRPKASRLTPSNTDVLGAQLELNSWDEGENLKDACARSNFKGLAVALNMNKDLLQSEKGEFESRESFEKHQTSISEIMEGRPLLICQRLTSDSAIKFQYIGDFQHFLGAMPANNAVFTDTRFIKNYTGTSAFGVRASIRATLESQYRLDLVSRTIKSSCVDIYLVGNDYQYFFKVPAASKDAAVLKETGRLVVIGKASRPYVAEYFQDGEPSIDNPFDEAVHSLSVSIIPKSMHIIDGGGKEVWSCELAS